MEGQFNAQLQTLTLLLSGAMIGPSWFWRILQNGPYGTQLLP